MSSKPVGQGDVSRCHGYSSIRRAREASEDFLQREKTKQDQHPKVKAVFFLVLLLKKL